MLQEDPVLFQLYKDLVVSQVISADEFWANRLGDINNSDSTPYNNKQDVGISGAFLVSTSLWSLYSSKHSNLFKHGHLRHHNTMKFNRSSFFASQADIRPQTDGCNGLRYNLTADIIESIFRTYPAGKRSHLNFEVCNSRKILLQAQIFISSKDNTDFTD